MNAARIKVLRFEGYLRLFMSEKLPIFGKRVRSSILFRNCQICKIKFMCKENHKNPIKLWHYYSCMERERHMNINKGTHTQRYNAHKSIVKDKRCLISQETRSKIVRCICPNLYEYFNFYLFFMMEYI